MIDKFITVWCDVQYCNEHTRTGTTDSRDARAEIKRSGWSSRRAFVEHDGGNRMADFCPKHSKAKP